MTHDELLARVKTMRTTGDGHMYMENALRAAVELHKPDQYGCMHCQEISGPSCPTIEAIEKELK